VEVLPASAEGIARALATLSDGGCIAHATETCYGLACDLQNLDAVANLFATKDRPTGQPVSALFASLEQAKEYVVWNACAEELAVHLPGPLTIILELRADAPSALFPNPTPNSRLPTLGIRISSHPLAQALASGFGSPLVTTSANVHGRPETYSAEEILAQCAGRERKPDLLLDSGPLSRVPPSTVIDCASNVRRIVRAGPLLSL
jgi:L-threonylcarbamoyladenylate synthase